MQISQLRISNKLDLWPSGYGGGIGYVDERIDEISKRLMAPIFVEKESMAVLLSIPELGIISLQAESENGQPVSIVVDASVDPYKASKLIDTALGSMLKIRWPKGARL